MSLSLSEVLLMQEEPILWKNLPDAGPQHSSLHLPHPLMILDSSVWQRLGDYWEGFFSKKINTNLLHEFLKFSFLRILYSFVCVTLLTLASSNVLVWCKKFLSYPTGIATCILQFTFCQQPLWFHHFLIWIRNTTMLAWAAESVQMLVNKFCGPTYYTHFVDKMVMNRTHQKYFTTNTLNRNDYTRMIIWLVLFRCILCVG